jgi:RNA polymerase sigma-70 factor (ECF subfamily)
MIRRSAAEQGGARPRGRDYPIHESEAVDRLKRGDIGGLETLVRLYQSQALDAAVLITRDYAAAEDVVQEAFLRALRHIQAFDGTRPFGPWFLRIVVHGALTTASKAAAQRELSLEARSTPGWTPKRARPSISRCRAWSLEPGLQEMLEAAETREEILSALEGLSPGQRAAMVMRYYLDWSDAEASERLGDAPGTVRWRLNRARERLRQLLPPWVTHPQKGES